MRFCSWCKDPHNTGGSKSKWNYSYPFNLFQTHKNSSCAHCSRRSFNNGCWHRRRHHFLGTGWWRWWFIASSRNFWYLRLNIRSCYWIWNVLQLALGPCFGRLQSESRWPLALQTARLCSVQPKQLWTLWEEALISKCLNRIFSPDF
jgi:hypothetical protein